MILLRMIYQQLSRYLSKRPSLMFAIQQRGLRLAYYILDLKAASWVIRRPEWLLQQSKADTTNIAPPLLPVDAEQRANDIKLAARVISAYTSAATGEDGSGVDIPPRSIWGTLRQTHFKTICTLVEKKDSHALADYYSSIFRRTEVNGFTYGTTFVHRPHRWNYLPVAIELSVVTLAESLGLLRAETHEQGVIAHWRRQFTEEELIRKLEEVLHLRIEAPRAGDPRVIAFGGRYLARETCSHIYTAYRISKVLDDLQFTKPLRIVEIGGGYGGTCYWLHKLLPGRVERYVIVDLPEVSLIQAYFLAKSDVNNVKLYGELMRDDSAHIELLPHFRLDEMKLQPNILINQDSMPEMPESEVARYLEWASRNLSGVFFSFNQEAYSPIDGIPQVHVPSIASRFPVLRRISRETSWDRRGYVEEVYITTNPKNCTA